MRLFDAVNGDKLAVPSPLLKLEAKLRKEWAKNDKAAKRAGKTVNDTKKVARTQKPVMGKRKASGSIIPKDTKKAKPTTAASHDTPSKPSFRPISSADSTSTTPVSTSQRCGILQGTRRGALMSTGSSNFLSALTSSPKQTARRSAPFAVRGRSSSLETQTSRYDNPGNIDEPNDTGDDNNDDHLEPYSEDEGDKANVSYTPVMYLHDRYTSYLSLCGR
ncbi:hypothetical protein S40293_11132 [Stachybotrys chartarum IBT 40293]|nr:hypothetical protein S40293_11132 [Stachybotrys chartarum IBT 40293]